MRRCAGPACGGSCGGRRVAGRSGCTGGGGRRVLLFHGSRFLGIVGIIRFCRCGFRLFRRWFGNGFLITCRFRSVRLVFGRLLGCGGWFLRRLFFRGCGFPFKGVSRFRGRLCGLVPGFRLGSLPLFLRLGRFLCRSGFLTAAVGRIIVRSVASPQQDQQQNPYSQGTLLPARLGNGGWGNGCSRTRRGQGPLVALEGNGLGLGLLRSGRRMGAGQGVNQIQRALGGNLRQGAGAELGFKIVFERNHLLLDVGAFRIAQLAAFRIAHGQSLRAELPDQVLDMAGIRRKINMAEGIRLLQRLDKIAVDIESRGKRRGCFHERRQLIFRRPSTIFLRPFQFKRNAVRTWAF